VVDAPLSESRPGFRRHSETGLIIAKGQGNDESLSERAAPIYFLFKVKCSVVAEHIGEPGTHVVTRSDR